MKRNPAPIPKMRHDVFANARIILRASEQPQPLRTFQRSDRQQRPQRAADRIRFRPFRRRHGLLAVPVAGMRKEAAARPAAARVGAVAPIGEEIALRLRHKGVALCRLYASPGSFAWECKPATLSRKRGGRNKTVLAAHRLRPRLVHHAATKQKATSFASREKEGSGAPKGALSNQCPRQARLRAALWRRAAFRRSRLRHSPPGSTPMAQLQNRVSRGLTDGCFARFAKLPRLSTLRADRSLCRSTGDPKPPGARYRWPMSTD